MSLIGQIYASIWPSGRVHRCRKCKKKFKQVCRNQKYCPKHKVKRGGIQIK